MVKKTTKNTKKKKGQKEGKKVVKVNVDSGGPVFFSDSVTIFHNLRNFILDFQQATPRLTRFGDEKSQQSIYIRHNTIILDPFVAKEFLKILQENIKKS